MSRLSRHPVALAVTALLAFALGVGGLAAVWHPSASSIAYTANGYVIHECDRLQHFSDAPQMASYLKTEAQMWQDFRGGGGITVFTSGGGGPTALGGGPRPTAFETGYSGNPADYSGTNVQVGGIDEVDIVKTDGTYVYTVSGEEVVIVRAYPPSQAGVVARITSVDHPSGLFVRDARLVVFGDDWSYDYLRYGGSRTTVDVFDISTPSAPALVQNVSVDGYRVGARLIDGYMYAVFSGNAYLSEDDVVLPGVWVGGDARVLSPDEVGYFRDNPYGPSMTMVLALDLDTVREPTLAPFLTGYVGELYVSYGTLYLAGFVYRPSDDDTWAGRTAIHAIDFDGLTVRYACTAEVPGSLLSQWSMDEHDGYLRVATTVNAWGWGGSGMSSGVYVLDPSLDLAGSVEGIAPGESIYSIRFLGDRAYLVTFKKIDPFFVLDLADPASPRILGSLEIPGFSDYLHPFGSDYMIGVGKDAVDMGDFAWYQGIKLSLFEFSDPTNPQEVANVIIGDRGSESEVRQDHKAFLLDTERNLMVIPVLIAEVADHSEPSNYGTPVWQGAIVYRVSTSGFLEEARITHGAVSGGIDESARDVRRSLYIEDVLYTVSGSLVGMNDLTTFASLGEVAL